MKKVIVPNQPINSDETKSTNPQRPLEDTVDLERRNRALAVLDAIVTAVTQPSELPQVLEAAAEHTLVLFDADVAVVLLVDEQAGCLCLQAVHGPSSHIARHLDGLKLEESLCGQVVLTGQPLVVRDVANDPRSLAETQQADLSLLALAPLKVRERVLGVLGVASSQPQPFTVEDEHLLETIGRQVSIVVENVRLHEETQRRLGEMAALHETSSDITTEVDLHEVVRAIVERASKLLQAQGGAIYLYDPDRDELVLVVSTISWKDYTGTTLKLGEGLAGKVALTGEPIVVDDYSQWEGRSPKFEGEPITTTVAVPMRWQEQIIGTINIARDAEVGTFTLEDVDLLSWFAEQAAMAIAYARLWERYKGAGHPDTNLKAANERLELINKRLLAAYQVGSAISGALGLDAVQQRIADEMVKTLGFDFGLIAAVDAKERTLSRLLFAGVEPSILRQVEMLAGVPINSSISLDATENLAIQASRAGQVETTHDLHELLRPGVSQDAAAAIQELMGVQTIAVVSLTIKAKLVGALAGMTVQPEIGEDTLIALRIFASQAAIAIANARLFEDVVQMAEQIERQNKELLETRDRLVKAERLAAIGQIGLTIRHEINNPLTAILGLTQWLLEQESCLSEGVRNDLQTIEEMTIRIRDIIRKLETIEDRTTTYLGDTRMIDLH
jgi:GAF domain-containing protein